MTSAPGFCECNPTLKNSGSITTLGKLSKKEGNWAVGELFPAKHPLYYDSFTWMFRWFLEGIPSFTTNLGWPTGGFLVAPPHETPPHQLRLHWGFTSATTAGRKQKNVATQKSDLIPFFGMIWLYINNGVIGIDKYMNIYSNPILLDLIIFFWIWSYMIVPNSYNMAI